MANPAHYSTARLIGSLPNAEIASGSVMQATHPNHTKKNKRAQAGRRCAYEDCPTVLSTYNRKFTCWLHTPLKPRR